MVLRKEKNNMLLEEPTLFERFEILSEGSNGEKTYKLRGIFSRCDAANKNKRVYRRAIMEEVINDLQESIKNGGFVGELDHPPTPKVNMKEISHKVTKLALAEDGAILGEIVPAGPRKQDFIQLMEDKIQLGVSTRGVGSVKPYSGPLGEGLVEVQPGYKMKAIDIVFDPSAGTYPEKVFEDTQEEDDRKILLASPTVFKAIWDDVFGRK